MTNVQASFRAKWKLLCPGLNFHDWIDYYEVAFSIELLQWGRTFSDIWDKTVLHICG